MDLRFYAGQVRRHVATQGQRGRHRMPGRSFLARRWGWTSDRRVRSMMKAEAFWVDPLARKQGVPNAYQTRTKRVPNSTPNPPDSQDPAYQARTKPVPNVSTRAVLTDTQIHRVTPQRESGSASTSRATGEPEAPPPTLGVEAGLGSLSREVDLEITSGGDDADGSASPMPPEPAPIADPPAEPATLTVTGSDKSPAELNNDSSSMTPSPGATATTPTVWYQDRRGDERCSGCATKRGIPHGDDCRFTPAMPRARDGPAKAAANPFTNPFTRPESR